MMIACHGRDSGGIEAASKSSCRARGPEEYPSRLDTKRWQIVIEGTWQLQADAYEEEERLANLYVACSQLHGSLDLRQVVTVILEICVNLIGASRASVFVHDEERGKLIPVASSDGRLPLEEMTFGSDELGGERGRKVLFGDEKSPSVAMVPMVVSGRTVGAVVVHGLLPQKPRLSSLDQDLLEMLSWQGATAFYGACVASLTKHTIRAGDVRSRLEG